MSRKRQNKAGSTAKRSKRPGASSGGTARSAGGFMQGIVGVFRRVVRSDRKKSSGLEIALMVLLLLAIVAFMLFRSA